MILEGIESLRISGKEVVGKKGESLVVVRILFSTWGLVVLFSITLSINSLMSSRKGIVVWEGYNIL